jgi:hypothetical protein
MNGVAHPFQRRVEAEVRKGPSVVWCESASRIVKGRIHMSTLRERKSRRSQFKSEACEHCLVPQRSWQITGQYRSSVAVPDTEDEPSRRPLKLRETRHCRRRKFPENRSSPFNSSSSIHSVYDVAMYATHTLDKRCSLPRGLKVAVCDLCERLDVLVIREI